MEYVLVQHVLELNSDAALVSAGLTMTDVMATAAAATAVMNSTAVS